MNHGLRDVYLEFIKKTLSENCKGISSVALFGSRATGLYKPYSDIDLVIHGDVTEQENNHLHTLFLESTLPYKVDTAVYQHITHLPLKQQIDQHSKTLFTKQDLYG